MPEKHAFSFFRAGGVDQVVLRDGADIAHLAELDQKLWVALACPVKGLGIDEKTLAVLDLDGDLRIRVPEVIAAVTFSKDVFKSLDMLVEPGASIALDEINAKTDTGKAVLRGAKRVLVDSGKKADKVSLDEVEAAQKAMAETRFNGDGVIPPDAAEDEPVRTVIHEMMDCVGSVPDRSGKMGIGREGIDAFFTEVGSMIAWADEGLDKSVTPLGAESSNAAEAVGKVRDKIVDYFTRCRVAAFDPRAAQALGATEAELAGLSRGALARDAAELARLPLAQIEANRPLPLEAGLNPAWADAMRAFTDRAARPLLGASRPSLSEADFQTIESKLAAHVLWHAKKPETRAEKLGVERLRAILSTDAKAQIEALLEKDLALADDYASIELVEKAVRVRRDFLKFLRNFVNFADFYGRKGASFQAGTLYLDARGCELVVGVADAAKHATLAGLSNAYLAYCNCTRKGRDPMGIVAAFTAGDIDHLMVGRNGIFYDRVGDDWDATITSIVSNPISVRQAFFAPYKRLIRIVEEQIAKRAAAKEKESSGSMDELGANVANADAKAPPLAAAPPPAPAPAVPTAAPAPGAPAAGEPKKFDAGMVAAIAVAVAGIASFLGGIVGMFLGLGLWMPLGIVAVLLLISGPSMVIAWLKLRQRNLGPILDANGWAINGRMKVNVPFGGSLTKVAQLPENASRSLDDPFAEKPTPWRRWVLLAIVFALAVAWSLGKLDRFLPAKVRTVNVFPPVASASAPPPAAPPAASAAK